MLYSRKEPFSRSSPVSFPVAIAKWYLCKCPETGLACPLYPDSSHLTAEMCGSGVTITLGFEGAQDSFFPCLNYMIMSASVLLFLCFLFLPKILSEGVHGFGSQTLCPVWTAGLCSWAQPSHWHGLSCPVGLLEMCLPGWIKSCHWSTFMHLPLVLSQPLTDSSK